MCPLPTQVFAQPGPYFEYGADTVIPVCEVVVVNNVTWVFYVIETVTFTSFSLINQYHGLCLETLVSQ